MFLSAYHFDGDPAALLAAHDHLAKGFEDAFVLNVCVARDGGITVYDACPSRAEFETFSASAEFHGAVAAAGLPGARIEPLGEVHSVHAARAARA